MFKSIGQITEEVPMIPTNTRHCQQPRGLLLDNYKCWSKPTELLDY